jgi:hypothetical protein
LRIRPRYMTLRLVIVSTPSTSSNNKFTRHMAHNNSRRLATARAARIILWQLSLNRSSSSCFFVQLYLRTLRGCQDPPSSLTMYVIPMLTSRNAKRKQTVHTAKLSDIYISIIALRWGGGCAARHQIILTCKCPCRSIAIGL